MGERHAPGSVAISWVELLSRAEARDSGAAGAWHRGLPLVSGMAGASEHCKHVIAEGRIIKCFEFQVWSTARSVVEASATLG